MSRCDRSQTAYRNQALYSFRALGFDTTLRLAQGVVQPVGTRPTMAYHLAVVISNGESHRRTAYEVQLSLFRLEIYFHTPQQVADALLHSLTGYKDDRLTALVSFPNCIEMGYNRIPMGAGE